MTSDRDVVAQTIFWTQSDAGKTMTTESAEAMADAIMASDWLARVKREAASEALEEAAEGLNVHFQDLPSWTASYKAGERSDDWMKGGTRMVIDSIELLRARAAELREGK